VKFACTRLIAAAALAVGAIATQASSHREALAVLNEPCADNTDTYAWVKPGTHDKLYLIMNFNPLHEPGQGNQGLRACNGYRYEFHIGIGESLKSRVIYRVEFKERPVERQIGFYSDESGSAGKHSAGSSPKAAKAETPGRANPKRAAARRTR